MLLGVQQRYKAQAANAELLEKQKAQDAAAAQQAAQEKQFADAAAAADKAAAAAKAAAAQAAQAAQQAAAVQAATEAAAAAAAAAAKAEELRQQRAALEAEAAPLEAKVSGAAAAAADLAARKAKAVQDEGTRTRPLARSLSALLFVFLSFFLSFRGGCLFRPSQRRPSLLTTRLPSLLFFPFLAAALRVCLHAQTLRSPDS